MNKTILPDAPGVLSAKDLALNLVYVPGQIPRNNLRAHIAAREEQLWNALCEADSQAYDKRAAQNKLIDSEEQLRLATERLNAMINMRNASDHDREAAAF